MGYHKNILVYFILTTVLFSNSISIFSGQNQLSIKNKSNKNKSLLQSIIDFNYFNFQYAINIKNSFNVEVSSNERNRNILSFQNRYSIINSEKLYTGISVSLDDDNIDNLNVVFGSTFNFENSVLIGLICNTPLNMSKNPFVNFYIGAQL